MCYKIISESLNRDVEILTPQVPQFTKPEYSPKLSLLNLAIEQESANKRNFFKELAENPELAGANDPEVEKDLQNRRAVAQFFDAMPKVLKNLRIDTNIVMPIMQNEFNDPLPDYGLSDYAIFFTVGERLYDRFSKEGLGLFEVKTEIATGGHPIDIWHNTLYHSWFADVKLDYKTENEWGDIILYLLNNCMPVIRMHNK